MMRASQEELNLIKKAMDSEKKVRVFKRYQALYLFLSGKTRKEVAQIVGVSPNTVTNVYTAYKTEGLAGIVDKPILGRPTRLTNEQQAELKLVILSKIPSEVGFPAEFNWTAGLIGKYIKCKYNYDYSIRGITKMLDRMGLSYTRPTYVLAKADKQKQEQFVQDFAKVKKLLDGKIQQILFVDESMIRDYQAIHQTWFERGKQRIIRTFGKHRGVKLVGYLNYETGEIYCEEHDTYDAKIFLKFLENLLSKNPKGKTVVILDNARIHHAKLLESFLKENETLLQLMFLPPYSPNLNLIEGLWKWLKEKVIYNVFYKTVPEIRKNVNAFLKTISAEPEAVIQRLCCKL
ncbi:IS630 family transposase [Anaerocolumna jejuensis]|uniref:IS630 family transposase n=1 Tax=Anaerocolumna jejuensis TaxID=259063 RepID=UPI0038B88793